ncbi:MAG: hypothetical protein ABI649_03025 [Gaiellaceae bacterium]
MPRVIALVLVLLVGVVACVPVMSQSKSEKVARELGDLKTRMDEVDRAVLAIQPQQPVTPESIRDYARRVAVVIPRYEPIQEDIEAIQDDAQAVDDDDVVEAARLLTVMMEQRYDGMKEFVSNVASNTFTEEYVTKLQQINDATNATNAQFTEIAQRLNERYG